MAFVTGAGSDIGRTTAIAFAHEGAKVVGVDRDGRASGGTEAGRQAAIAQDPVGRMGTPEEIAAAVLWLCSDQAPFTIGHALVIDGGQTI